MGRALRDETCERESERWDWSGIVWEEEIWCGGVWKSEKIFSLLRVLIYIIDNIKIIDCLQALKKKSSLSRG